MVMHQQQRDLGATVAVAVVLRCCESRGDAIERMDADRNTADWMKRQSWGT